MTLFLVVLGVLYVHGWYSRWRLRRERVLVWRLAAFMGGLVAIWVAVASPVSHLNHHLLTAHMAQHLLLMVFSAPLILFGAVPIILLPPMKLGSSRLRTIHMPLWFCWLAGSLTVIVWHIPAIFEIALKSDRWHGFEQASFFIAGLLFWSPVTLRAGPASGWSVPLYLFLASLPCDILSAILTFTGSVVYRPYLDRGGLFQLSPMEDQALAGAVMWVTVTLAYLVPTLVLTARSLSGTGGEAGRRKLGQSETASRSYEV